MKFNYPIKWVPATPEYILASIQEEWRQTAKLEGFEPMEVEQELPTFDTTIQQWRDTMDLVGPWELSRALNKEWNTNFTWEQWREVFQPARRKALREVCELLASQAKRPVAAPAKRLGKTCESAGLFLSIRSALIQAGAPAAGIRPSTAISPYLRKWPKVFTKQVARLSPGGLPYTSAHDSWRTLVIAGSIAGLLLIVLGRESLGIVIFGIAVIVLSWTVGLCIRRPLTLEGVNTFRDLVKLILEKKRLYGFAYEKDQAKL